MQKRSNAVGYKWISEAYGIKPVQPFRVRSVIGTGRSTESNNGFVLNTYSSAYEPAPLLRAHLAFALKYEGVDLDFLFRVFAVTGPAPIFEWLQTEPQGQYARRCGFLYEWLTDSVIEGVADASCNYVDLLDAGRYLTATKADKVRRWRINNNLPGTRDFCPMVDAADVDSIEPGVLRSEIDNLYDTYGPKTVERAVSYLTITESKASFLIESEGREEDRIRRLAKAMSTLPGQIDSALSDEGMLEIQRAIMGDKVLQGALGVRQSPVFVGHTSLIGKPVIDYLAPPHEEVPSMMAGLRAYEERTRGQNPLLRAAALSFGFVYIHPLGDGNGRLSRFLINDILRRDGFMPAPVILPVSAVISENAAGRQQYDAALERLSRPLMASIGGLCGFGATKRYPDGVESNLHVSDWAPGGSTWRYADLTFQTRYLVGVIEHSIRRGLKDEAQYLSRFDAALSSLKELIEGRDEDYAQIIRSITQNTGVSGKLRRTYPVIFEDEVLAARIVRGVLEAFEPSEPAARDVDLVQPVLTVRPRQR